MHLLCRSFQRLQAYAIHTLGEKNTVWNEIEDYTRHSDPVKVMAPYKALSVMSTNSSDVNQNQQDNSAVVNASEALS